MRPLYMLGIKICFQGGGRGQEFAFESQLKRQTDPSKCLDLEEISNTLFSLKFCNYIIQS